MLNDNNVNLTYQTNNNQKTLRKLNIQSDIYTIYVDLEKNTKNDLSINEIEHKLKLNFIK